MRNRQIPNLTPEQLRDVARVNREQTEAVRKTKAGRKQPVKNSTTSKAPRGRRSK